MIPLITMAFLLWSPTQNVDAKNIHRTLKDCEMGDYITDMAVSLNDAQQQMLECQGFDKINIDLNKGAGGKDIYLWYKTGNVAPITRVQVSFNDDTSVGLTKAGYQKIPKDLNAGAGGADIFLWFFRGSTEYDTPIVDLMVTTEAADEAPLFQYGWERVDCDLNRDAGGDWIYAWVKREKPTYICDVTATSSYGAHANLFKEGYIRVDEDLNSGAGGANVFAWYRKTKTPSKALNKLSISSRDAEYSSLQNELYTIVNVDLNKDTGGYKVYMWYKKDPAVKPIQALTVLYNKDALDLYIKAGIQVIKRDLNSGNNGHEVYLTYYH